MADITNNYEAGSCIFEAGSSQNGDVHITGGTFYQGGAETSSSTPADKDVDIAPVSQLSNRQLVILISTILDLSLAPEFLNQKALSRLLAAISGKSEGSLRQSIMDICKNGYETQEARQDMLTVAALLEKINPSLANQLKNDAKE